MEKILCHDESASVIAGENLEGQQLGFLDVRPTDWIRVRLSEVAVLVYDGGLHSDDFGQCSSRASVVSATLVVAVALRLLVGRDCRQKREGDSQGDD